MTDQSVVPPESRTLELRAQRVMLDSDLAELYGVEVRVLHQAVRRNRERFPPDFMFQLTAEEKRRVITQCDRLERLRFSRHLPRAFTEQGVMMAANVLNSRRAIDGSVFVVRAFVRLRSIYASHRELARRLDELDVRICQHDSELRSIVEVIRRLAVPRVLERDRF